MEEYNEMAKQQNGKCAICLELPVGRWNKLLVDHNHLNNKIRGLLCDICNRGLGYFKDNIDLLKAATKYLLENDFT